MARWLNIGLLALILAAFSLQALLAIARLSATADEPVHLAAGYSYWQMRDFRMNPEHPPLAKLLAALPLLAINPEFDTTHDDWKTALEYQFGFNFLYGNHADQLLFWSRAAMVLVAALGLIVTFLWARDMFGPPAGLFAASMYAFSPNLLAHGMLVATDVPLAVFWLLTLYLLWKRGDHPSWRIDLAIGLALGATMATKFSGAFLPIILAGVCLARDRRSAFKGLLIMACGSLFVIEAAYLFSVSPVLYFKNAALVNANHLKNYPVYLFGRLKPGGWWYYFLAGFAVKATVPTLILLMLTAAHAAKGLMNRWGEIILLTNICLSVVIVSAAADQIGVRYLLPMFPLVFVWTSRIVPYFARLRAGAVVLAALLLWQAWSSLHAFPNYIPYFNELAGGASAGPSLLDDSNVDWGQGLKQAARYVREHHLENVTVYSFSPFDNPAYYGLPRNLQPSEAFGRLLAKQPAPGVYIISAHYVTRMRAVDPAWRKYKPVDRIGESLWVYEF